MYAGVHSGLSHVGAAEGSFRAEGTVGASPASRAACLTGVWVVAEAVLGG